MKLKKKYIYKNLANIYKSCLSTLTHHLQLTTDRQSFVNVILMKKETSTEKYMKTQKIYLTKKIKEIIII